MVRYLLILMIMATPCFAQGLGNMMGSPQGSFQDYGNTILPYGDFSQNYGNNPNVYENYLPQVGDYLKQDPRRFKGTNNLVQGQQGNDYKIRRYNKFQQFDYTLSPY